LAAKEQQNKRREERKTEAVEGGMKGANRRRCPSVIISVLVQ
jgi:hypothetical protein